MRLDERGQDVLGRGLTGRSGDRDHASARALAHRTPERSHGRLGILGDEHRRGSATQRLRGKLRAATDGDKQVARRDAARVDHDAGNLALAGGNLEPARTETRYFLQG